MYMQVLTFGLLSHLLLPEDFVNYKVQSKEIVDPVAEKICMSSRGQYAIYSARRHIYSFVLKRKKKGGKSPMLGVQT